MLTSAVLLGCGLGLGLGAAYMAAGLGQVTPQDAAEARLTEQVLQYQISDATPVASADRPFFPSIRLRGFQHDGATQIAQPVTARRDLDCLTQAVYFEARGESSRGQQAVAQVVLNRVKSPSYPKTVCGVVYQGAKSRGCQFSFACDGSMRRGRESAAWNDARRVASRALAGAVLSDIGGATHFHTTGVSPNWGPRMLRVAQVGLHVFYKTGPYRRNAAPMDVEAEHAVFVSLPAARTSPLSDLRLVSSVADATPVEPAAKSAPTPVPVEAKPVAAASATHSGSDAVSVSARAVDQTAS